MDCNGNSVMPDLATSTNSNADAMPAVPVLSGGSRRLSTADAWSSLAQLQWAAVRAVGEAKAAVKHEGDVRGHDASRQRCVGLLLVANTASHTAITRDGVSLSPRCRSLLAMDPIDAAPGFQLEMRKRQERHEHIRDLLTRAQEAAARLQAATAEEVQRRAAKAAALAEESRQAEAASRLAMAECEAETRAYLRAWQRHMAAVAAAELAAMSAEEAWQRAFAARFRRAEAAREERERAAMWDVERRQRVVDAALRRAEMQRERAECDAMAAEERRQRAFEAELLELERRVEADERDAMHRAEQEQLACVQQMVLLSRRAWL